MTFKMKQLKDDPFFKKSRANLDLFIEMISIKRGYESQAEIVFNKKYLDERVPNMKKDAFGNRYVVIGKNPKPPIMFACHTDTVHRGDSGKQRVAYDANKKHIFLSDKNANCLGADNTTGVWLCLELIRAGVPGLYVFHRGEEAGCVGSNYIVRETPKFAKDVKICISLDRRGTNEIITHQMGQRCASEELGSALAKELNKFAGFKYRTSDRGAFTDSEVYASIVPECINVGVGYEAQHSRNEYQDVKHMVNLRKALINVNWSNVLQKVTRVAQPKITIPVPNLPKYKANGKGSSIPQFSAYEEMYTYVKENPDVITDFLMDMGIDETELWEYEYGLIHGDQTNEKIAEEAAKQHIEIAEMS